MQIIATKTVRVGIGIGIGIEIEIEIGIGIEGQVAMTSDCNETGAIHTRMGIGLHGGSIPIPKYSPGQYQQAGAAYDQWLPLPSVLSVGISINDFDWVEG